jgi:hypothetical protein
MTSSLSLSGGRLKSERLSMRSLGRLSPRATFVDGARRGSVDERGHEELHVSPDPLHQRRRLRRHMEKIGARNERDYGSGSESESGEGETQLVRDRGRQRSHNHAGDERAKRRIGPSPARPTGKRERSSRSRWEWVRRARALRRSAVGRDGHPGGQHVEGERRCRSRARSGKDQT